MKPTDGQQGSASHPFRDRHQTAHVRQMDTFDGDEGTLFMQIVLCPGDESILESLSLGPRVERSETVNRNDAL
jgi:hypothetical protein